MSHHLSHEHHTPDSLPFEEKLMRLLEHWIRHNEDHAASYREWARQAGNHRLEEAASRIEEAAHATEAITEMFKKALSSLHRP